MTGFDRSLSRRAIGCVVLASALASTGCSVVFPAHQNSYDLEGEKIRLTLLDRATLCTRGDKLGFTVKGCPTGNAALAFAPAGVAAANMAIGLAAEFIQEELKKEAKRYEAQFEKRVVSTNFWTKTGTSLTPTYAGFELTRTTAAHNDPESNYAFKFIAEFVQLDGTFFQVRPVLLHDRSTKAKVLKKYLSIASWFNWFTKAVDEVEVTVQVDLEQVYLDEKKAMHVEKILAAPLKFTGYGLSQPAKWTSTELSNADTDIFPGVRISDQGGSGVFRLTVRATERDPSNAASLLNRGAKLISDNESKLKIGDNEEKKDE